MPRFVAAPTELELEAVDRELTFFPASTTNPSRLSVAQLESFNRDGFIQGLSVFDAETMQKHRTYFDELLNAVLAAGGDAYSISSAHLKYPEVYDLLVNPVIVDYVADLLGPDVVGWGSHYFCKLAGDEKAVDWHQDASYWPMSQTKTVTVWLAIDDADVENGCMQFVAGSHRFGHLAHETNQKTRDGVLGRGIGDVSRYGTVVDNPLLAGQVSIHSDLLVHASKPNPSKRRRCGLTLRYCAAEVRAAMGWHVKGVVVRGADPDRHWANASRPA